MADAALLFSLFVLLQQVAGSIYLYTRLEDVPTPLCNLGIGAGEAGNLCSTRDLSSQCLNMMGNRKVDKNGDCEKDNLQKSEQQCKQCKMTKDEMESNSLTSKVKPNDSTVFTCSVQDSGGGASSICPSWITLTGPGCEDHHLFLVVNLSEPDEIFSTDKNPTSLTVSERDNVTLTCQFELRKTRPFTLLWITSENKCLSSIHTEQYEVHSNARCCVDGKSAQRIFNHTSPNPTEKIQFLNLTIHSVEMTDSGRYLCVLHGMESGQPVWKIAANISLNVTESCMESTHSPTSASGSSVVTSSGAHTMERGGAHTNWKYRITMIIALVCVFVPICVVGVYLMIRKKQMGKDHSATGLSNDSAQLTQGNECVAYSLVPRRERADENEHVAYSVTEVPAPPSQPRPDKGQEEIHSIPASTEHVYCLIKEPAVKGDGDTTEIQEVKSEDTRSHKTSAPIELNNLSLLKEGDPMPLLTDQTYSLIGSAGAGSLGETVPQSGPEHGLFKMEENPIYSK
ncbi:uncharacterized protein LOC125446882 [Stegostoma tigrinum]|uniref:uncharacterized protein LOC125446882 n=1 Tax=Stegostoma tigrinum TaxID=3053191 RepID=UPI0028702AE4|nr:uncharacterized protein LOC125446882 [Stegostoma tigrinum]